MDTPSCLRGNRALSNRSALAMEQLFTSAPGTRASVFFSHSDSNKGLHVSWINQAGSGIRQKHRNVSFVEGGLKSEVQHP